MTSHYAAFTSPKHAAGITTGAHTFNPEVSMKGKLMLLAVASGLLLKAIRRHIKQDWILMYIERWLTAPFETAQGDRSPRSRQ